jgi:hypothetical protein
LQFGFLLAHPLIAHRLVLGRIRVDLGAVERHVPKLHQSSPPDSPSARQQNPLFPRQAPSICITTMRENTSNQQRSVGSKMLFETSLAVHVDVFAIPFVQ